VIGLTPLLEITVQPMTFTVQAIVASGETVAEVATKSELYAMNVLLKLLEFTQERPVALLTTKQSFIVSVAAADDEKSIMSEAEFDEASICRLSNSQFAIAAAEIAMVYAPVHRMPTPFVAS